MGQTFSLKHEINNTGNINNTSAVMLLVYEKSSLTPLSFLDFLREPVSYASNPIIMIEPFQGEVPPLDNQTKDKISHSDFLRTVHQNYRITPYQFKTFRLWLFEKPSLHHHEWQVNNA